LWKQVLNEKRGEKQQTNKQKKTTQKTQKRDEG